MNDSTCNGKEAIFVAKKPLPFLHLRFYSKYPSAIVNMATYLLYTNISGVHTNSAGTLTYSIPL